MKTRKTSFRLLLPAILIALYGGGLSAAPKGEDSLQLLFWNLENFFDNRNDSTSVSEGEFSSYGARHWTRKRFYAKCNAVAKTLLWSGMPDVAAFAEVENARVLRRLRDSTVLVKSDYVPVHYDSPDRRGIDVALLYREKRLILLESRPFPVDLPGTRDILYARFRERESGREFSLLVCHLPSKYGGAAASDSRRVRAVGSLRHLVDSLPGPLLLCGDFNDTPDSPAFRPLETVLVNLSAPLHEKGEGTLRYDGKWDLIDQTWATPDLASHANTLIQRPPFLLTRDSAHGGMKPRRTYSGPRHLGGVSDHLPVLTRFRLLPE